MFRTTDFKVGDKIKIRDTCKSIGVSKDVMDKLRKQVFTVKAIRDRGFIVVLENNYGFSDNWVEHVDETKGQLQLWQTLE